MIRYYETIVDERFKAESDFVYRKRHGSLLKSLFFYVCGMAALLGLFMVRDTLGGNTPFFIAVSCVLILLILNFVVSVQKNLDLVMAIEFQNALFSSAFREGKMFSMIVGQSDQMYYADSGFYKLFPDFAHHDTQVLDQIVRNSDTPKENLERLNAALLNRTPESMQIYLTQDGQEVIADFSVIPLPRPSGYFFISAQKRSTISEEERLGVAIYEEVEHMLDLFLDHMEDMAYILDGQGHILVVTRSLATKLGYESPQMMKGHEIVHYMMAPPYPDAPTYAATAFEHDRVEFRKKSGGTISSLVSHKILDRGDDAAMLVLGKVDAA